MQTGSKPRALVPVFNRVVLQLAPTFHANSLAPSTFNELRQCERLIVWDGASDATIYGDATVNHAFRAWHDSAHLRGGYDFTPEGEYLAAKLQCADILQAYPSAPELWLDLVMAEVVGQVEYVAKNGAFPLDQIGFIRSLVCHS